MCSSYLQLPLESLDLATEGLHLRAAWGCRLVLQRLLKAEDLLGEFCNLRWGMSVVTLSPGLGAAAVREVGQKLVREGHNLEARELWPSG